MYRMYNLRFIPSYIIHSHGHNSALPQDGVSLQYLPCRGAHLWRGRSQCGGGTRTAGVVTVMVPGWLHQMNTVWKSWETGDLSKTQD